MDRKMKEKKFEISIFDEHGQIDWAEGSKKECLDYSIKTFSPEQSRLIVIRPALKI